MKNKNNYNNMSLQPQLLDLIKKYDLKWEYCGYYLEDSGKKHIIRSNPEKKTQSREEFINTYKWIADKENKDFHICSFINIKNSPLAMIDIDEDEDIETLNKKFGFTTNTLTTKGNSKGYHFYIECDDFIDCKKKIDCLKHFDGDIITDTFMENETKEFLNNEIVKINKEDIFKIANFKFEKSKKKELNENENEIKEIKEFTYATFEGNLEELEEIVMNIPVKYADNWSEWIIIISILKKYNLYDLSKSFSKKSKQFVEERFSNDYNTASFKDYDIGTIYYYSKENKTSYEKIINKYKKIKQELYKKNQIENAELEYSKIEDDFNKNHFKIINKNIFIKEEQNDKLITFTPKNFKDAYLHLTYEGINKKSGEPQNQAFIEKYMKANPNMRKYTDMDTYPDSSKCPIDNYNLWRKFDVEKITEYEEDPVGLKFILNHIKILCDHEIEVYEYVLDFLAHMFQKPHEKAGIFVLFISKQGTGKGLLFELLSNMLGNDKVFETPTPERDVWGSHNSRMMNSYLVNLEELRFLATKGAEGIFKNYITQPKMLINPKGKDQIEITSYHRFIGSMNPEDSNIPMKTVEGDRRNLLIRCSDETKGNTEYFNELIKLINSKNLQKTFHNYLMNRPDADLFRNKKIPVTEYHKDIQESQEDVIIKFIKDSILDKVLENKSYKSTEIFNLFKEYKINMNVPFDTSHALFTLKLKQQNFIGLQFKRKTAGVFCDIDIDILKDELKISDVLDHKEILFDSDSD